MESFLGNVFMSVLSEKVESFVCLGRLITYEFKVPRKLKPLSV